MCVCGEDLQQQRLLWQAHNAAFCWGWCGVEAPCSWALSGSLRGRRERKSKGETSPLRLMPLSLWQLALIGKESASQIIYRNRLILANESHTSLSLRHPQIHTETHCMMVHLWPHTPTLPVHKDSQPVRIWHYNPPSLLFFSPHNFIFSIAGSAVQSSESLPHHNIQFDALPETQEQMTGCISIRDVVYIYI